jgi:hypothetical protein
MEKFKKNFQAKDKVMSNFLTYVRVNFRGLSLPPIPYKVGKLWETKFPLLIAVISILLYICGYSVHKEMVSALPCVISPPIA